MGKSIFYRLFGLGKVPGKALSSLSGEDIRFMEEGIGGTIILRNFRMPGRYNSYRANWFMGSIVLTNNRFLAFQFHKPIVHVPWNDPRIQALDCSIRKNALCIKFDASVFHEKWSGDVEVRYKSENREKILRLIKDKAAF